MYPNDAKVASKSENVDKLFYHVVALDLFRILSRLRSRHAARTLKTADKPALIVQLDQALNKSSAKTSTKLAKEKSKTLKSRVETLIDLFEKLEKLPGLSLNQSEACDLLRQIVIQAHEITLYTNLGAALERSRTDPCLKSHLIEALKKLGRYYSAASELVCAARDKTCPIFRNVKVEPFQIPIPSSIHLRHLKIHAEIQLLFFYEINRDRLLPRTICSSKSACYLCNLFFDLHGGFLIPRTHGRLYEKWILPDWIDVPKDRRQKLCTVLTRLKSTLEIRIKNASKSTKRSYSHPNESVLHPLAHWPSSSALSRPIKPSPRGSVSTIHPICPLTPKESPKVDVLYPDLPLTPPSESLISGLISQDEIRAKSNIVKADTSEIRKPDSPSSLVVTSKVFVGLEDLPYSQRIVLTTPSLHLQLDELFISLEFVQVASGSLSIVKDISNLCGKTDHLIDAKDIPTSAEMRFECSKGSSTLLLRLAASPSRSISLSFVWDEKH